MMTTNRRVLLLWTCLGLFLLRVLGQLEVALGQGQGWLPTMERWYSGYVAYPLLIPAQILLLMWMTAVAYDNSRGAGLFHVERPRSRRVLNRLAIFYLLAMVVRYIVQVGLVPELGGHTIPILFHWLLAAFVALLAVPPLPCPEPSGKLRASHHGAQI